MKTNEARVDFSLDGDDFDPNAVTRFLGIEPTSIKCKGKNVYGRVTKYSSWQFSTKNIVNEYIDIFEMTRNIIDKSDRSLFLNHCNAR